MALLQYDLGVTGQEKVKRVLRGVEREFQAHGQRVDRISSRSGPYRNAASPRSSTRRQVNEFARGMNEIGKAARAADLKRGRDRIREEKRVNQQILRERKRMIDRAAREEHQATLRAQRGRERIARGIVSHAGRGIGNVVGAGTSMLGLAGGALFANAARQQMSYSNSLAVIANQAYGNPGENRTRTQIQGDVGKVVNTQVKRTGMKRSDIADTLRSFVAISGDLKGAEKMTPRLLDLSDALGVQNVGDMGKAAGLIKDLLERKGVSKGKSGGQTLDVLRAIGMHTKVGSVEFNELVSQLPQLVGSAGQFQGGPAGLMKSISAMTQLAIKGGASSGAEAATSAARLPTDIIMHAKRFKAAGVNVFNKEGTAIRDPLQIIKETIEKNHGHLKNIPQLFGIRSQRIVKPFLAAYNQAGGGKKGAAAIDKMMAPFQKEMTAGDVTKGAEFQRAQAARKTQKAFEELNIKIGEALLPAIEKLAPSLEKLVEPAGKAATAIAKFISWATDHPAEGIGVIVGASITKELAKAGIPMLMEKALSNPTTGAITITAAAAYLTVREFNKEMADVSTTAGLVKTGQDVIHSQNVTAAPAVIKKIRKHIDTLQHTSPGVLAKTEGWLTGSDPEKMRQTEIASLKTELLQIKKRFHLNDNGEAADMKGAAAAQKAAAKQLSDAATSIKNNSGGDNNRHDPIVNH